MATETKAAIALDDDSSFVEAIRPLVRSTFRSEVIKGTGAMGGMFSIPADKYRNMVLISTANGLGAKIRLAIQASSFDTIGRDLVALCVNDLLVRGAEPLFMLDYYATSHLNRELALEVMNGLVAGCREAHCTLLGGKTSETPCSDLGDYFDLAGFAVGAVEQDKLLDGSAIAIGQQLIGIASSGLHGSGYSLALKILFKDHKLSLDHCPEELGGESLQEALLRPTRIYVKTILNLIRDFKVAGLAHIGAGGLLGGLTRVLPASCQAVLRTDQWPRPPIFSVLTRLGQVDEAEMARTFNQGLGMVAVVPATQHHDVIDRLTSLGENAFRIGEIVRREEGQPALRFE